MTAITDSVREFMNALIAAGVDPARVERALARAPSAAALGVALVREGAATHEQLLAAQRRWASRASPLQAVKRLGPYAIVRRLGAGAAGEVYLVRDPATGVQFAAKRLIDLGDLEERLRFQREARLLAQLDHPHLAKIHAADLEGPTPYFVLDYYAGGTLKQTLAKGPLPEAQARALLDKLASALEAAHAVGVLHRDLKPENVLLDERGEPRLADFGLGLQLTAHSNRLTQTGVIMGTPSYMAPEQVQDAKRVDVRSDVYGLGAVLYACLTGQPPIPPQASLIATLYAVVEDPVQPPSALAQVSPRLEAVCLRALEKDPELRFSTVAELRAALGGESVATPSRSSARLYFALPVTLALAAAVGLWLAVSHRLRAQPAELAEPPRVAEPTPEPADLPRAARITSIESALAREDTRAAWQQLIELGDGEDVAPVALKLLESAQSAEVFAVVSGRENLAWRGLWRLARACEALERVVFRSVEELMLERVEQRVEDPGSQRRKELGEVERLANLVSPPTGWTVTSDALLLRAVDLCLRARLALQISETAFEASAVSPPPECPQALAAAKAAKTLAQIWNATGRTGMPPGDPALLRAELKAQRSSLTERFAGARAWERRWPVFLVGHLLCEAAGGVDLNLARSWFARLKAPYPAPHSDLALICRNLAYHSLSMGPVWDAPDLELAAGLVDLAEVLHPLERTPGKRERAWVGVLEVTRGDLEAAEVALAGTSDSNRQGRAALLIERARRERAGRRAPLLRQAADLLHELPRRDAATWVALTHIALLGVGEDEAFEAPTERWEEVSDVDPFPCPTPWYSRYEPRRCKLPGEAGPQRTLWLPPLP